MTQDDVDALLRWQLASQPGQLPPYDEVLLRRELALFPDWYLARHRGVTLNDAQAARAAGMPVMIVPYGYNEGRPASSIWTVRSRAPRSPSPRPASGQRTLRRPAAA